MHPFFRYWDEKGRTNANILLALYRDDYVGAVDDELQWLLKDYSVVARYGRAHPAPCPIWRAERNLHFHGDEWDARFANRVHIFDGTGGKCPGDSTEIISKQRRYDPDQRYLGYVSLRPDRHKRFPSVDLYDPAFYLKTSCVIR